MKDLDQSVTELAALRESARPAREILRKMDEAYQASPAHMKAVAAAGATADAVGSLEAEVRQDALLVYQQNGSKHPHLAVEIKMARTIVYDPTEVRDWCLELMPSVLVVDPKKFEAACKAGLVLEDVYDDKVEPRAYIKTDLSAVGGGADQDKP